MPSQSLNHHVEFDFVEVTAVVQVKDTEELLKGVVLVIRVKVHTNRFEALTYLGFFQFAVLVEVKFIENF